MQVEKKHFHKIGRKGGKKKRKNKKEFLASEEEAGYI